MLRTQEGYEALVWAASCFSSGLEFVRQRQRFSVDESCGDRAFTGRRPSLTGDASVNEGGRFPNVRPSVQVARFRSLMQTENSQGALFANFSFGCCCMRFCPTSAGGSRLDLAFSHALVAVQAARSQDVTLQASSLGQHRTRTGECALDGEGGAGTQKSLQGCRGYALPPQPKT